MACSLLLGYPDERLDDEIAGVRAGSDSLPGVLRDELESFCATAQSWGLRALQEHYVRTFDQRRKCALWLTYYTHGDTRARGQAILAFREVMLRAGFEMAREELPDHLPVVLEFCALADSDDGERLLEANRECLEVVRTALHSGDSPYAHLLDALLMTLPEPDERTLAAYRSMINQGPPTEMVGIGSPSGTTALTLETR
ncbi:MAG: nitrate reductase molybdenum cofactor assembly chaperone [Propionibacterium sp.]